MSDTGIDAANKLQGDVKEVFGVLYKFISAVAFMTNKEGGMSEEEVQRRLREIIVESGNNIQNEYVHIEVPLENGIRKAFEDKVKVDPNLQDCTFIGNDFLCPKVKYEYAVNKYVETLVQSVSVIKQLPAQTFIDEVDKHLQDDSRNVTEITLPSKNLLMATIDNLNQTSGKITTVGVDNKTNSLFMVTDTLNLNGKIKNRNSFTDAYIKAMVVDKDYSDEVSRKNWLYKNDLDAHAVIKFIGSSQEEQKEEFRKADYKVFNSKNGEIVTKKDKVEAKIEKLEQSIQKNEATECIIYDAAFKSNEMSHNLKQAYVHVKDKGNSLDIHDEKGQVKHIDLSALNEHDKEVTIQMAIDKIKVKGFCVLNEEIIDFEQKRAEGKAYNPGQFKDAWSGMSFNKNATYTKSRMSPEEWAQHNNLTVLSEGISTYVKTKSPHGINEMMDITSSVTQTLTTDFKKIEDSILQNKEKIVSSVVTSVSKLLDKTDLSVEDKNKIQIAISIQLSGMDNDEFLSLALNDKKDGYEQIISNSNGKEYNAINDMVNKHVNTALEDYGQKAVDSTLSRYDEREAAPYIKLVEKVVATQSTYKTDNNERKHSRISAADVRDASGYIDNIKEKMQEKTASIEEIKATKEQHTDMGGKEI